MFSGNIVLSYLDSNEFSIEPELQYCIVGNFGEVFIWWTGIFAEERQILNPPILNHAVV